MYTVQKSTMYCTVQNSTVYGTENRALESKRPLLCLRPKTICFLVKGCSMGGAVIIIRYFSCGQRAQMPII